MLRAPLLFLSLCLVGASLGRSHRHRGIDFRLSASSDHEDATLAPAGKDTIADKLHGDDRFSRLTDALGASKGLRSGLDDPKAHVTVFAPTNEAFEEFDKLPKTEWDTEEILRYHVHDDPVKRGDLYDGHLLKTDLKLDGLGGRQQYLRVSKSGNRWYLNMYSEITDDVDADNGVINVVNRVVIPPPDLFTGLFELPSQFSIFTTALQATDLAKELKKGRAMTVFVPTNRAFDALGVDNLAHLFSPNGIADLEKILKFSMLPSLFYADELTEEAHDLNVPTLLKGEDLHVKARTRKARGSSDRLWDVEVGDGVRIEHLDVVAHNGVAHVVGRLVVPGSVTLPHKRHGSRL